MPSSKLATTLLLCLATAAGCGGKEEEVPRAAAEGTVTAGGAPLAAGSVIFTPSGEGPRVTASVVDGAFALPAGAGPAVGHNTARVVPADPAAPEPDDESAALRLRNAPPVPARLPPPAEFPAHVAAGGPNAFAFDLPPAR